ncbi:MAG TPA: GlsB/YeaQ/YmgE family stress response membrane protein [Natronosporangium sp.]
MIGLVIGVLARLILPGRQNINIILTIIVGIVAALIGTAIAEALNISETDGVDWIELGIQVLLAIIGVGLVSAFRSRSRAI